MRHRTPYKSNSMGVGVGGVATEGSGSLRPRPPPTSKYNRAGFGRGQSKHFLFHGNDIFMEAGRLAAEYLVSKGLLPPNALSGKLNTPNYDVDQGRARSSRRPFPDEHNSRNFMRRNDSFRNYSSEFKPTSSRPDVDDQDDTFPSEVAKDSNELLPNSLPGKINPDIESAALGDSCKETSPTNTLPSDGEPQPNNKSDDIEISKKEAALVFSLASNSHGLEEIAVKEDIQVKLFSKEHNQTSKTTNNLLSLCRFGNVPTRTRSSLANKGLKVCHDSVAEDADAYEGGLPKETEVYSIDIPVAVSPGVILSHQSNDVKIVDSDKLEPPPSSEEESCRTYAIKQLNDTSSSSFPESTFMGRVEKRELDNNDDCKRGTKRPKDVALLSSTYSDGFLYHSNPMEKQQTSQETRTSHGEPVMFPSEEKGLVDIAMIPDGDVSLGSDFTEKQHMPGSFKTFDLNIMETTDVNENHDAGPVHIFPVIAEGVKQEASSVDIHLAMSSSSNITGKYAKSSFDGRDVEVIDLENDSEQEEKAFYNPERRSEAVFTGPDSFTNIAHSTNNIPNASDGYGLMISELLGNDIPNCSSLPADMNSLHNDMGLHNGEGMLGDDDSIYMSLGEIPISFLTAWEQPTQEFGKPF